MALFAQAGIQPTLVTAAVAFDPSQQLIREQRAIGLVGESSADGLSGGLVWVPLADPAPRMAIQLVLRAGALAPAAERVAVAAAAAAGWLGD